MAIECKRNALELEICEALNLKRVRKLDIHFGINELSTVTAEFYPEVDGVKQFVPILKKFKLEPIEDDNGEPKGPAETDQGGKDRGGE